jgi:hypothetical protein
MNHRETPIIDPIFNSIVQSRLGILYISPAVLKFKGISEEEDIKTHIQFTRICQLFQISNH